MNFFSIVLFSAVIFLGCKDSFDDKSSNLESLKTDILIPSTAKLFDERNQRIGYLESSQNMNNLRNR